MKNLFWCLWRKFITFIQYNDSLIALYFAYIIIYLQSDINNFDIFFCCFIAVISSVIAMERTMKKKALEKGERNSNKKYPKY